VLKIYIYHAPISLGLVWALDLIGRLNKNASDNNNSLCQFFMISNTKIARYSFKLIEKP
jgi:hypothetical protein